MAVLFVLAGYGYNRLTAIMSQATLTPKPSQMCSIKRWRVKRRMDGKLLSVSAGIFPVPCVISADCHGDIVKARKTWAHLLHPVLLCLVWLDRRGAVRLSCHPLAIHVPAWRFGTVYRVIYLMIMLVVGGVITDDCRLHQLGHITWCAVSDQGLVREQEHSLYWPKSRQLNREHNVVFCVDIRLGLRYYYDLNALWFENADAA